MPSMLWKSTGRDVQEVRVGENIVTVANGVPHDVPSAHATAVKTKLDALAHTVSTVIGSHKEV